ncbi:hypothetical protein AALA54_04875 [Oscillospiraceae bacterium 44-34]
MDHPFRSAAVGGFNKQDVLTFLEEQSKQAAQVQQQLSGQLEEAGRQIETLRQEREDLRRQLEEAQRELETARQGRDSLNAQLEQTDRELSASQKETVQARQELEQVRREWETVCGERDKLQAKLDGVLPDARAYVQIKDRTAGVELDAHRRAQSIQEKAERDAQRVRRQLEQWLERMEKEYSAMRGEVEITVSHAASELDRVRAGLNRITQLVDTQEGALEGIAKTYGETAGPKVEAPMPIPEE